MENYIEQCVNSVLSQEFDDFEIILIDDGSTDGSARICDNYSKRDKRIIVIHQANKGLSCARNAGIEKAAGDYLIFLDSDDYLDSDALLNLGLLIGEEAYDLIINRCNQYDESNGKLYVCPYQLKDSVFNNKKPLNIYKILLKKKHFTFTAWLFVVKKNFLLRNGLFFYPGLIHEDEL